MDLQLPSPTFAPIAPPDGGRALRFRHDAMATVFELYLFDQTPSDAQAVSREVFADIDRLEKKLSYFLPGSEVWQINTLCAGQSVALSPATFDCLQTAQKVNRMTGGAFDPTVGPMLRNRRRWDKPDALAAGAPADSAPRIGMHLLVLDEQRRTVTATADGVRVDLGGVAKGFAVDEAARILTDWGVGSAMIVAGQSTMMPIGLPPGEEGWSMRIRDPRNETDLLQQLCIHDCALSTSAAVNESHILDPQTGRPVREILGAWAIAGSGAESDAISTAILVMGVEPAQKLCAAYPDLAAALFTAEGRFVPLGRWPKADGEGTLCMSKSNSEPLPS